MRFWYKLKSYNDWSKDKEINDKFILIAQITGNEDLIQVK